MYNLHEIDSQVSEIKTWTSLLKGGHIFEWQMGMLFCLPQLSKSENRTYFIEQTVGLVYNFKYLKRCCMSSICAPDPGPANVRAALVDWGH